MRLHKIGSLSRWCEINYTVGKNVRLGRYTVIEDGVCIGDNCVVGHHVILHSGTQIGNNVRIDDNAVLGKLPMRAVASATTEEKVFSPLIIGDGCLIGAQAVLYRGAALDERILVADFASIREDVSIGKKTIIGSNVTIENKCIIGRRCKLETKSYVTAFSEIEDYCFLAPGVTTSNDNYMGRDEERFRHFMGVVIRKGGRIGANATILPGITIHEDGQVAAGAVVTKDVPARKIVLGVPAGIWKDVPPSQLLENQLFYQQEEGKRK